MHFPNNTLFNSCLEFSLVLFRLFKLPMLAVGMALLLMPPATFGQGYLEEIVVTARKRAESMQDAPVTVTAFSQEALERYNTDQMASLAGLTPGLVIGPSAGISGPVISLRGVSTGPGHPSTEQSIAIVTDGVAMSHAGIVRTSQFDNRQVEVLKGPQALFYGKNSPGGVISFSSADPGDELEMSVRTGYEFEAEEIYAEAVISGPISDTVRGRLVVFGSSMDGWADNTAVDIPGVVNASHRSKLPELDEEFVRGTLVFEPSDRLSMKTKVSLYRSDGSPYYSTIPNAFCPGGVDPLGIPCTINASGQAAEYDLIQDIVDFSPYHDSTTPDYEEDWLMLSHQIDFDINDNLHLTSVTGYLDSESVYRGDVATGRIYGLNVSTSLFMENFTQEFRLNSSFDSALNFSAGVHYGDSKNTGLILAFVYGGPGVVIPLAPDDPYYVVESDSLSVFAELIWDISDSLELSVGARYSDESKEWNPSEAGVPVPKDIFVGDLDFTNTSPEATLSWRPTENATYYFSYKEGFKSGGINNTFIVGGIAGNPANTPASPLDTSYDQETVDGFEIGAKLELLDQRLRLNAALYRYEFNDMQLSTFDSETIVTRILNAGAATIEGAEIDLLYSTDIEGLFLSLGLAYNDATFDEFLGGCYNTQTEAEGCIPRPAPLPGYQDFAGRPLPHSPEINGNLGLVYETELSDDWGLSSALNLEYSDEYFSQQEEAPTSLQESYTRVNANLTLRFKEQLEFSLIGVNLTEEWVRGTGGHAVLAPPGYMSASLSRGRQISLQAKWTY